MAPGPTLVELLHRDLGPDFPVVSGRGRADDPLVLSELRDYVAVEYAVVRQIMAALGEEWALAQQGVRHSEGRVIDELVVDVKDSGAAEWQGRRRFHFDITAGWNATYGHSET